MPRRAFICRRDARRFGPAALSLLVALIVAAPAAGRSSPRSPVLSEHILLSRLTDPAAALTPLTAGARVSEVSSHDLLNGNFDGGAYSPRLGHPPTFVRREAGGYVLLDQAGPGCVTRLWMTSASGYVLGDIRDFGRLQLFVDGRRRPAVDEPVTTFFAGGDPRFPRPLVGDRLSSSGGNYSYVPFCFAQRIKLRVTGAPPSASGYFQVTLVSVPYGTPVSPFGAGDTRGEAVRAARALASTGRPPQRPADGGASARAGPGRTATLIRLRGAGTIRYLHLTVTPFTERALQALRLRIAVDGGSPQIDLPLGSLFGDGLQIRLIRSVGFGMSPLEHAGYLAFPVPYGHGAVVSIRAGVPARVGVRLWRDPASPTAGTLYGQYRVARTTLGHDYRVLDAGGSGRLVSLVDEVLNGGRDNLERARPPDEGYMEGDDRAYLDGSRSPAIYGTGTEDIFNGGWYFIHGPFQLPLSGAGPLERNRDGAGARSMYRIFGGDGPVWNTGIRFGIQHGGGDDRVGARIATTTFSYRRPRTLVSGDAIDFGSTASMRAHHLGGARSTRRLTAYFEGERSGNGYYLTQPIGAIYAAPPPGTSSDAYAARGIAFARSISFELRIDPRNTGIVLRRLLDQSRRSVLRVSVDGRSAGEWDANQYANPVKRWLESDLDLPPALTFSRGRIRVTLTPQPGLTDTVFFLRASARVPASSLTTAR